VWTTLALSPKAARQARHPSGRASSAARRVVSPFGLAARGRGARALVFCTVRRARSV
jgi:hypothetical protein